LSTREFIFLSAEPQVSAETDDGLFIGAWAGLPIEAVVVWIAVTYATTIVYEIVKVWRASGKDAKHALLGKSSVGRNQ
jgi:hypothetical protein